MLNPVWHSPRYALRLAMQRLDCEAADAADWLIVELENALRRSRAKLAKIHDTHPPREVWGQDVPKGLWRKPKQSAWTAEHAPPVVFGWSFWNTGNREVTGSQGVQIELIGIEIDVADIVSFADDSPGAAQCSSGEAVRRTGSSDVSRQTEADFSTLSGQEQDKAICNSTAGPAAATSRRPVSETSLQEWFKGFASQHDISAMNVDGEILSAAQAYFSSHHVSRQRIRALVGAIDPGRKQGPKPIRQDRPA